MPIIFQPWLPVNCLKNAQMVGWGVKIAVIDSGVNGNYVSKRVSFCNSGVDDFVGHGSMVGDILKHVARGAEILSAKIGDENPDELNAMRALEWAVEQQADVINLSCGFRHRRACTEERQYQICRLINRIVEAESIAVVVAAGNNGPRDNTICCPGCAENAITVGAVNTTNDNVERYSSRGKPGGSKPNILAPAKVYFDELLTWGTSYAAPVVAGVIAAGLSKLNDMDQVKKVLFATARDLNIPAHYQGAGVLDLQKFVEVVSNGTINSRSQG